MFDLIRNFISHPFGEVNPFHGFVKNLDAKSFRIALAEDYGHCRRAILCFSRPDFPQSPRPTDYSRIIIIGEWYKLKRQGIMSGYVL
jgi:hypothetical protein